MAAFLDLCRFTAAAGGTSDWAYSSVVSPYLSPTESGAVNGRAYKVRAESADQTQWEVSEGVYSSAGAGSFARTSVLYNSAGTGTLQGGAGTKVNFSLAPQVWVVASKRDLISIDEANSFTAAQKSQVKANLKISGPTVTLLNSGVSATYNSPAGCTRIFVRGVGGGGGSGNAAAAGQTDGGNTTLSDGTLTLTATGGAKGTGQSGLSSVGGAGTNGHINHRGGDGVGAFSGVAAGTFYPGQPGGATFLHPTGGRHSAVGETNSGAGGGVPYSYGAVSSYGAGAGGGGFERWIDAPAASWTYTIGAAGAAGTGGFAGAAGRIVIEEFYD